MKMLITTFLFPLLLAAANAAGPTLIRYDSYSDLEKGVAQGIMISRDGRLILAPKLSELYSSAEPFIWCSAVDRRGRLIIGTGNDGMVYALSKDGDAALLLDGDDPEVYAVACAANGDVYAGTSPSAKIFKISTDGATRQIADLEEKYIWAMVLDGTGNLLVATGEPGNVYKIDGKGNVTRLFTSTETHLRSMTWGADGDLLIGSSKNAYLYRVRPDGVAFTLYDAPLEEIHSLVVDEDGCIYAAALKRATSPSGMEEQIQQRVTEETILEPQIISLTAAPKEMESALYKIDRSGNARELWSSSSDWVQCIALSPSAQVIIGTGSEGKMLSLSPTGDLSLLAKLEGTHVTSLLYGPDNALYATTSHLGNAYRLGPEPERKGTYTSPVIDAGVIARWGELQFSKSSSSLALYTRSGNTEMPNDTWSPWLVYSAAEGAQIASPSARYLQWKVEMAGDKSPESVALSNIRVSYMQTNIPPEIKAITLSPPGRYYPLRREADEGKANAAPKGIDKPLPLGNPENRQGYRSASWLFEDMNDDLLIFDIYYKRLAGTHWQQLRADHDANFISWNSQMMPDGQYQLRIVARDAPSNPPPSAEEAEKISEIFVIDNTPPEVNDLKYDEGSARITFIVSDSWSRIGRVELSVNAREWQNLYPLDGILDSKHERFDCTLESPGDEVEIVVKTADEIGNIGFGTLIKGSK